MLAGVSAALAAAAWSPPPLPAAAVLDNCGLKIGAPYLPDSRKPVEKAAKVANAIISGCTSAVSGLRIMGDLVFPTVVLEEHVSILGSIVDGSIVFIDVPAPPEGITLSGTTATGLVLFDGLRSSVPGSPVKLTFKDSRFQNELRITANPAAEGAAIPAALDIFMEEARVDGPAHFRNVRFTSLNLSGAVIEEVNWNSVTFDGPISPPARVDRRSSGMSWDLVREHRPKSLSEADFLGQ